VLDHQRRVGQRVELNVAEETAAAVSDGRPSPENVVVYRSEFARLVRILDRLSPRCREVFVLCRFEELSHAEIASRPGISRNTVVSHMVSALAAIERETGADEDLAAARSWQIAFHPSRQ
jgi:RNA polymerase sigma factor (sigma-70 family)